MPTNPTDVALQGHRYQAIVGNALRNANVHLAQSVDFTWRKNSDQYLELGNIDVVDAADDPLEPSATIERAMVGDLVIETIIASAAVDATSVTVGAMSTNGSGLKVYGTTRNSSGTVIMDREMLSSVISEAGYSFNAAGVLMESFSFDGKTLVTADSGMNTWQTEGVTHRIIKGRDAIITIGGSNDEDDVIWRVQTFNIRIGFPTTRVNEMGNRDLAGIVGDPPTISMDFEVLEADIEPDKLLTGSVATGTDKDYNTPSDLTTIIRVYNPSDSRAALGSTESATPVKSFKIENSRLVGGGIRSQVRGLGTKRFSLISAKATTAGSAGMTIYAGDVA